MWLQGIDKVRLTYQDQGQGKINQDQGQGKIKVTFKGRYSYASDLHLICIIQNDPLS